MVLIPIEEYKELLAEAGYKTTPRLTREIREARAFQKRQIHPMGEISSELNLVKGMFESSI